MESFEPKPHGDSISAESMLDPLRAVIDPELGIDIVSLGLVYEAQSIDDTLRVRMTMTTPTCPLSTMLRDQAGAALKRAFPHMEIDVALVWDPPWSPDRMSDEAKRTLGW
jgi:metal-sulfur cluster biosynthetic enzyme